MFLKSETKTDRKPAVKITLQYKLSNALCEKTNSYARISKLNSRNHFDGLSQSLESKRDHKRRNLLRISFS